MNRRQTVWFVLMLIGGAVPLLIVGYWFEMTGGRSPEALAMADACVDWAHKPRDLRALDGPDLAQRCDRYFRVRSDHDGDEDETRWKARQTAKDGG
jgi:hypothetical protein